MNAIETAISNIVATAGVMGQNDSYGLDFSQQQATLKQQLSELFTVLGDKRSDEVVATIYILIRATADVGAAWGGDEEELKRRTDFGARSLRALNRAIARA